MDERDNPDNLEDAVVVLTKSSWTEFPKNRILTGTFLAVKNLVFAMQDRLHLGVYNLSTGAEITSFPFEFMQIQDSNSLATDGGWLYLNVRGNFDLEGQDILLARLMEGDDFLLHFYGKPLRELQSEGLHLHGASNQNGIESKIVAIPLEALTKPAVIWDYERLFRFSAPRYLVAKEMGDIWGFIHLESRHGYAEGFYKRTTDPEDYFGSASFLLKEGKLYNPDKKEFESLKTQHKRKIPESIHITKDVYTGVQASNETDLGGREAIYTPIPVVFAGESPLPSERIMKMQQDDDKLFILLRGEVDADRREGIKYVISPYEMLTYDISLKKLESLEI